MQQNGKFNGWGRRVVRAAVTIAAAVVLTAVGASAGAAGAAPAADGARASFGGKTINLAVTWDKAQTCVVSTEDVRCFADAATADAAIGNEEMQAAAIPACADGWLCLYQYKDGGGKRLIFQDEDWQNLDDYGFDNKTSSYRNRQSDGGGKLAHLEDGEGDLYTLSSGAYVSDMGDYDNRASSVHP
ncbi:peptidase inhibitor family I36 protein [Actinosynnema sp. NPDC091369]